MKINRLIAGILLLTLLCVFVGCGNTNAQSESTAEAPENFESGESFVDLTALSSTMVYAEVYNMMVKPSDYIGKTVKMDGTFAVYKGDIRNYYACVIADATACCSQGIEFVWSGEHSYPEDYPELGSEIVVQGVFDVYEEDGYMYCQLIDATLSPAK